MLQPTSRRFLRELDEAPGGNNLQYIYYSVLTFLHLVTRVQTMKEHQEAMECTQNNGGKTKYYVVIFDQLQGHSRGLVWALELCVRGLLILFLFLSLDFIQIGQHWTNPSIDFDSILTHLSPPSLICHLTSHLQLQVVLPHCNDCYTPSQDKYRPEREGNSKFSLSVFSPVFPLLQGIGTLTCLRTTSRVLLKVLLTSLL